MATKKKAAKLAPKLSKTEQDLLQHLTHGYQLEVTGAEGAPVLRRLKDNEIVRPAGVNRSTIRALEEHRVAGFRVRWLWERLGSEKSQLV